MKMRISSILKVILLFSLTLTECKDMYSLSPAYDPKTLFSENAILMRFTFTNPALDDTYLYHFLASKFYSIFRGISGSNDESSLFINYVNTMLKKTFSDSSEEIMFNRNNFLLDFFFLIICTVPISITFLTGKLNPF